jgi:hypothetical protein
VKYKYKQKARYYHNLQVILSHQKNLKMCQKRQNRSKELIMVIEEKAEPKHRKVGVKTRTRKDKKLN